MREQRERDKVNGEARECGLGQAAAPFLTSHECTQRAAEQARISLVLSCASKKEHKRIRSNEFKINDSLKIDNSTPKPLSTNFSSKPISLYSLSARLQSHVC
ncbi:hypothetical protein, partial [Oleiphilus sp. HI0067]|uniref:hypothetical protein n=1 Tax=Oleiphilus sp. HI0067 TaxID=1822243 RepID=UPI001E43855B